mmetsp:Transcript_10962/g.34928  ORF Transcript_10962/g.34928 Transcript_10962/m.34928 type:complete len:230 (-) Transcript_10962:145-834(-)
MSSLSCSRAASSTGASLESGAMPYSEKTGSCSSPWSSSSNRASAPSSSSSLPRGTIWMASASAGSGPSFRCDLSSCISAASALCGEWTTRWQRMPCTSTGSKSTTCSRATPKKAHWRCNPRPTKCSSTLQASQTAAARMWGGKNSITEEVRKNRLTKVHAIARRVSGARNSSQKSNTRYSCMRTSAASSSSVRGTASGDGRLRPAGVDEGTEAPPSAAAAFTPGVDTVT